MARWSPRSRVAGLAVDLRVEGEPRPLAPGVDLTAYRLVQEAPDQRAQARWRRRRARHAALVEEQLELEVANRIGPGPAGLLTGSGHGLIGMRERVALCGGELRAGPSGAASSCAPACRARGVSRRAPAAAGRRA